ncbi:hypothetical protein JCM3765_001868 [Sporobolomyces pararoseus]
MTTLEAPAAPPISYDDTVKADVEDATNSSLFNLSISSDSFTPPPHPTLTSTNANTLSRRSRAPTLGSGDQLRRRRSNDEIRLPPSSEYSTQSTLNNTELAAQGGTDYRRLTSGGGAGGGSIRRANSTDLLSLLENYDDEENSDGGFSSEEEPFRFRPPSIASTATSQRSSRQGIRIEDASSRDNKIFVKQLSIPEYHAVGSEGSGFVVYDIEIQTLPTSFSAGTLIRAHKRYSAFVRLRADLVAAFPRLRRAIPRLPPKSSLAKYRRSFLEKRRQNLAFWLTNVLLHPILGGSSIVRNWVLE